MTLIGFELISAVLQLIAFSLVPFVVFLFRKDKSVSFLRYIGLYGTSSRAMLLVIAACLLTVSGGIGLVLVNEGMREAVTAPASVTGKLRMMGLSSSSVIMLLLIAWIKTSLSEEIFFRGFVAKRLIAWLGFNTGNVIQSAIFGLVHFALFWKLSHAGFASLTVIFFFSTLAGWTLGYIKEKIANGSVIPGWVAHGLGNTISYFVIAYVI